MRTVKVIIMLSMLSGFIRAQEVRFTAEATPSVLRVGEQFNLTFTSNNELEGITLPPMSDFELLGGPSESVSQSVYSVNGRTTTSLVFQYTYFLRALKEGKFTVNPVAVKIKGKTYRSNTVNIEVARAVSQPATRQPSQPVNNTRQSSPGLRDDDLFVRLVLDKREAYIGEQILATFKIYTKTNLSGIDQGFKGPDFVGFFTEPMEIPPLRNLQREVVDGDIYYTGVIRKMVVIPQKAGEITISPFNLDVTVRREIRRRIADPFFEDFSIPDIQEIGVTLKSKPVKVKVKTLPGNAPPSFKGAVGSFDLSSSLNKTQVATNEPLTLKIALTGRGNLKLINELDVEVPYDMEKYDPVINNRMDNPLSGSKIFEYLILPKVAGNYTIPPVKFTYFDTDQQAYKTLSTKAYEVEVIKGENDSLMAIVPGVNKEDVRLLSQDIRFIKTKPLQVKPIDRFIGSSVWYYLAYLLMIILFVALVFYHNRLMKQRADTKMVKLRRADKYARRRLKKAEVLLKQGNNAAFFEELLGATWGYLSDKLNIPLSSLSKESATAALQQRAVDQALSGRLFEIISTCEMARYAQGAISVASDDLYREALDVISLLQQKLR